MKITAARAEGFIRKPDPKIHAILVYGPDRGLVAERAIRLARNVVDDLSDPFRVCDLAGAALSKDPARLADEAAALSFTGGERVVRVRGAGNDLAGLFEDFIERSVEGSLVVVDAGELSGGSALRRVFERGSASAAIACYGDDPEQVRRVVQQTLADHGLSADSAALDYLAGHLGQDRLSTRSELEKLALYMGDRKTVGEDDVVASIGDGAPVTLDALALAVAGGQHGPAAQALRGLEMNGMASVSLLRGVSRHFQRLHLVAGRVGRGQRLDQAVGGLRPPVHFKSAAAFRRQAAEWTVAAAAEALDRLLDAEIACKRTGAADQLIAAATLLRLTEGARRRARRR